MQAARLNFASAFNDALPTDEDVVDHHDRLTRLVCAFNDALCAVRFDLLAGEHHRAVHTERQAGRRGQRAVRDASQPIKLQLLYDLGIHADNLREQRRVGDDCAQVDVVRKCHARRLHMVPEDDTAGVEQFNDEVVARIKEAERRARVQHHRELQLLGGGGGGARGRRRAGDGGCLVHFVSKVADLLGGIVAFEQCLRYRHDHAVAVFTKPRSQRSAKISAFSPHATDEHESLRSGGTHPAERFVSCRGSLTNFKGNLLDGTPLASLLHDLQIKRILRRRIFLKLRC
mmetsp:Transcript_19714/g.33853  ORF Transcript_19714/g.33853 Transcript_19714/m.33853 type:complete len:287 (+) Transcript_19714:771-1631(+)